MRYVVRAAVAVALAGLAFACIAEGQILKNRKPGLWELQYIGETSESSESSAQQSQMAERLANMPAEKRAQMEAYMKERGVGVSAGPGGRPMMTIRFCLTPAEIADDSGHSFMKGGMDKGECTPK